MSTEIISAIVTVAGVFITNLALMITFFLWNRAESRADIRHLDTKLESNRELVRAIHDEVRDFHMRLVDIEKRKA